MLAFCPNGLLPPLHDYPFTHATHLQQADDGPYVLTLPISSAFLGQGSNREGARSEVGHGYFCYFLVPRKDKGLCPIQPAPSQFLPEKEIQNAHTCSSPVCSRPGRLDGSVGLAGRLLPHPRSACPQTYLRFTFGLKQLQLTTLPIGLTSAPLGVHQGDDSGCSSSLEIRRDRVLPSQRLAVAGGLVSGSCLPPLD